MRMTRLLRATVLAAACSLSLAVSAQTSGPSTVDIPAGDLVDGLRALTRQSGAEFVYREDQLAGLRTRGVQGTLTTEQALSRLLEGSGFEVRRDPSGVLLIVRNDRPNATPAENRRGSTSSVEPPEVVELERIEVLGIGSNIRGAAADSSPVQVYERDDMARSGASTTQQFIQSLPQNFSGGSNDALVRGTPNDSASSSNLSLGSSVNLRGLGSGATLVLVDGQRLAPSSNVGDFVDISLLPINALKRVQVLTDGASAIYGGDAVAGVVNFVLRDDFEGSESFLSYGDVTSGSSAEYRAGHTYGFGWGSGNAVFAYDYHQREALSVLDKEFSRPIGRPIDLLPRQERHSAMTALNQNIGDSMDGWVRVLYSGRDARVVRSNTQDVPTRVTDAEGNQISAIAGLRGFLGDRWDFDLSGVYSQADNRSTTPTVPGAGVALSRKTRADQRSVEAKASGELFEMPGDSAKAALGVAYRRENFRSINLLTQVTDSDQGRNVASAFGEVLLPFVGRSNARPWFNRLEVNLSARVEDYSDFGRTSNPKAGLLWSPVEGVNFRATYGTSFQAPGMGYLGASDTQVNIFTNDILNSLLNLHPVVPDSRIAFFVLGTDPELGPEESVAKTFGFDIRKPVGSGVLGFSAGYYDIEFKDRINLLQVPGGAFNVYNIALSSPEFLPEGTVLIEPDVAFVTELLRRAEMEGGVLDQFGIFGGDPASVGLIAFIRLTNLSRTITRGIDMDLDYRFDTGIGDFHFTLNGNYILEFSQQASSPTPLTEFVGTVFRPADFRIRSGISWHRAGWSSSVFVNHTDSTTDDRPNPHVDIPSFTTVDWSLGYDVGGDVGAGILRNTRFRLGVDNVFDRPPPFIGNDFQFGILGYDPTNADPQGRFVSLMVTKVW